VENLDVDNAFQIRRIPFDGAILRNGRYRLSLRLLPEACLPLASGQVQPMARGYPMATTLAYLKGKEKEEDSQLRSPTLLSR
jgi:hypothetical protein